MFEQPRQQQDELIAQLQKCIAALEQENTLLKQTLANLPELEQRYRLLENRDRIFEATISASNALLTIENFNEAVNAALQIIGEKLDSDRVAGLDICFGAGYMARVAAEDNRLKSFLVLRNCFGQRDSTSTSTAKRLM